jgi:hypothetical protein
MGRIRARFVGLELYFENCEQTKTFHLETIGLDVSGQQVGQHAASAAIGQERLVRIEDPWAALDGSNGHNILLLQGSA